MTKIFLGATALSTLLILSGCGGGGSSSNGDSGNSTTSLKAYTAGTFVYRLTGTLTTPTNGTKTLNALGGRVLRTEAGSTANAFAVNATDNLVVDGEGSTAIDLRTNVTQQNDRSIVLNAINQTGGGTASTIRTLSNSIVFLPGLFVANTDSGTQTLRFTDSTTATYAFRIAGRRKLTVPQGTFNTYVVTATLTFAADDKRTGTFYYAPELGTYVRSEETVTRPGGVVAAFTADLLES